MPRVVKEAEERRAEILAAAQALFMAKGYAKTSIRDIIDAVGIAKGTFYHHFPSKSALLDGIGDQVRVQALAVAQPIVEDASRPPLERLNALFHTVGTWKIARRDLLMAMLRALRQPENLQLRTRMERESAHVVCAMLGRLIAEGSADGTFDVEDPKHTAELIYALVFHTSTTIGDLLVDDVPNAVEEARAAIAATHRAVGRILGVSEGSVHLMDMELVEPWFER